ncbi:MAG: NUDIX domain-containing protein [Nanoarchaeota archaeon]
MKRYVKGIAYECDPEFYDNFFGDPFRVNILIVKRKLAPYSGFYDFLGGGVEEDENEMDAMQREFKEELGACANWKLYCQEETSYKGKIVRVTFFTAHDILGELKQNKKELIELPYVWKRAYNIPLNRLAFELNRRVFERFKSDLENDIADHLDNLEFPRLNQQTP